MACRANLEPSYIHRRNAAMMGDFPFQACHERRQNQVVGSSDRTLDLFILATIFVPFSPGSFQIEHQVFHIEPQLA